MLDLQEALTPIYEYYPRYDHGTAYAYAEFTSKRRGHVKVHLAVQDSMKVWLNGALIHQSVAHPPLDTLDRHTAKGHIREGRNTVLVKVSKIPGQFRFSLDFESATEDPLDLKWWK